LDEPIRKIQKRYAVTFSTLHYSSTGLIIISACPSPNIELSTPLPPPPPSANDSQSVDAYGPGPVGVASLLVDDEKPRKEAEPEEVDRGKPTGLEPRTSSSLPPEPEQEGKPEIGEGLMDGSERKGTLWSSCRSLIDEGEEVNRSALLLLVLRSYCSRLEGTEDWRTGRR
jgi:hypothetical protein